MTYRLSPEISKITSPVILLTDGKKHSFENGAKAAEAHFNKKLFIKEIRAVENSIEITLEEAAIKGVNWIGEEQTYF